MDTLINGRWLLDLPEHRAVRPSWPWWEAESLAVTHHLITTMRDEDFMVVWDIGSEEGDFPALYSSWGASVVLVEPNPRVWPNIKWIWEHNDLGPPAGWFVGLASDVSRLAPPMPREGLDGYVLHGHPNGEWPNCADGEVIGNHGFVALFDGRDTIPQATLDLLREHMPKPDLVTMDIEGGEMLVLPHGRALFTEDRPLVVASLHPQFLGGQSAVSVMLAKMAEFGYRSKLICVDHEEHWVFIPSEIPEDRFGL